MAYLREDLLSNNKLSGASIGTAILPGWGTLMGYGTGAIVDDISQKGLWDYLTDPITSWGDIKKMDTGDIVAKLLDPGGALFKSGKKPPKEKTQADKINEILDKYRQAGLAGIEELARNEKEAAASRLAASGLDPSIGLKQAIYNPILERMAGQRAKLEGSLAQTELGFTSDQLNRDFQMAYADKMNQQNMYKGILDLLGVYLQSQKLNKTGTTTNTGTTTPTRFQNDQNYGIVDPNAFSADKVYGDYYKTYYGY